MQCQESRKVLDAYVDNEVDALQSVALEEHLAGCKDCTQTLQSRRALKDAIQDANLRETAPPELVKSVRKALQLPKEKSALAGWQWFKAASWGFAAATAIFVIVAVIALVRGHSSEEKLLAQGVTDDYIRSMMMENHGIDVVSTDKHTVKPWFNSKVTFSPQVEDFSEKGFPLKGGRLDYLDNQKVAALIYTRNQHVINVFQYPSTHSSGPEERQERGYNIIGWARNGMQYWVVSDLNLTELQQFVGLLRE